LQEWQHRLCDRNGARIVGMHDSLDRIHADLARRAVILARYGSIVNQEIESAELDANGFRRGYRGFVRIQIDVNKPHIEAFRLELLSSLPA